MGGFVLEVLNRMNRALFLIFLAGVVTAGVLGTETRLLFLWPACILLGFAGLMAMIRGRMRLRFPPSDLCLISVLLACGYVAVRAVQSPVQVFAREDLFMMCTALVTYVLMVTMASHPQWKIAVLGALLLLGIGNLVVGMVHFSGRWDFSVVPHFFRTYGPGRIGGFYNNPNHLAAFFSLASLVAAGVLCFGRGGVVWKFFLVFMVVSMVIGLSLTRSRGGMGGLAVGILVGSLIGLWIVWRTNRHLFRWLLPGGFAILVAGGGVLYKVNQDAVEHRMMVNPVEDDVRLHIWKAALDQHAEAPLLGQGSRMFYEGSIRHRDPESAVYENDALFAHNEYLQAMADYGWVGLGLLILVILTHAWTGLRFLHWFVSDKFARVGILQSNSLGLTIGALAALGATVAHAVFEFQWHVGSIAISTAVVLGILANPGFEGDHIKPLRIPGVRAAMRVAVVIASVLLLAGAWCFGRADYAAALADVDGKMQDDFAQLQHLGEAIEIDPRNPESFYKRGLIYAEKSGGTRVPLIQKAHQDLVEACRLNPWDYLYFLALADVEDALGNSEAARVAISRALILAPQHEEPRLALGIHFHRLGKFAEAERAYLWAGRSRAWNEKDSVRWDEKYRELLVHAASVVPTP